MQKETKVILFFDIYTSRNVLLKVFNKILFNSSFGEKRQPNKILNFMIAITQQVTLALKLLLCTFQEPLHSTVGALTQM